MLWSACTLPNSVLGLAEKPRRIEGVVSVLEECTDQVRTSARKGKTFGNSLQLKDMPPMGTLTRQKYYRLQRDALPDGRY